MNAAWWHHLDDASFSVVMEGTGKEAAYRFLKRSLQVIMAQRTERPFMLLKSPFHGLYLHALLDAFPDATLISLHRKPEAVVRSWISFMAIISAPSFRAGTVAMTTFAGRQLKFLLQNAKRLVDFLPHFEASQSTRHLALSFDDVVMDPLDTVDRIYGFLGQSTPGPAVHRRMRESLEKRAAMPSSGVKLSLDELGLNASDVSEQFADYRSQWGHLMGR